MKKILLPLLVLTLVLGSCKKYEEGHGFSLRSKKARVAGEWKIEKEIYNGQDEPLDADDKDDVWKFDKDGTFEFQDPGNSTQKGKWSFDDKKEKITLTDDGSSFAFVIEVIRLTNKEFWYTYTDGSDVSETHLMQ